MVLMVLQALLELADDPDGIDDTASTARIGR
jgi:hypothetical protein